FSPFPPRFLAGHPKAGAACSLGQAPLFLGEPKKIRCAARASDGQSFWEGPETRRAAKRKQRSTVPPGRRRCRQPAVPARSGGGKGSIATSSASRSAKHES